MQVIQDLTLIHKAAIGVTVALIMVLLLVSRRRRAGAGGAVEAAPPVAAKTRRRDRKKNSALPGRKRRKLAAEAAHAMGVDPTPVAAPQVPEVPAVTIPEVTVASAPLPQSPIDQVFEDIPVAEPVAPAVAVEPVTVPVMDDPYLHEAQANADGVFVAQPGWPTPGELASSFDPDAFDPLPDAYGPLKDGVDDDPYAEIDAESDDTSAIELPAFSTAGEVAALEEIEEWTDTYDANDNWNDETADDDATESTWTLSQQEPQPEVAAMAAPPAIDMQNLWSEPDDEPLWDVAEVAEAPGADIPAVAVMDEGLAFDAPEQAWADDSQDSWQADAFETQAAHEIAAAIPEMPAFQPASPAAWGGSIGGPNSPVVLDLAGLAASGHSLELVIEPNADGHGVRLRFGAPGAGPVEVPVVLDQMPQTELPMSPDDGVEATGMDDSFEAALADMSEPADPVIDMSFLTGVAPGDEPEAPVALPEPTTVTASAEVPFVAPHVTVDDVQAADAFADDPEPAGEDFAMQAAPVAATTVAVMDADDDPARILADIRARLAALDARR